MTLYSVNEHTSPLPERWALASPTKGWINPGQSVIVDPDGKMVAGPAEEEESILYAEVRPDQLIGPRWLLDVVGHYGRSGVFELRVHRRATKPLHIVEEPADDPRDEESV